MGTKYSSQTSSGYNSSPPSDDGSTAESNKVKWSTIKTKLADVVKTLADNINSALVTALNTSARAVSANDSAAATDHWRTIQVTTPSVTISLADATTMTTGYIVTVANQSSGDISVGLATATDTIDTVTNAVQTISAKHARTYIVNAAALGYISQSEATPLMGARFTNSLGADVNLSNTSNYFDGPSVAQGTAGVWFASGTVTLIDTAGSADFDVKLWDGSTVIASAQTQTGAASEKITVSLSGYLTSPPAGNLRISVKDKTSTSGLIKFNLSGNSKDSTISAIRIA